MVISALADQNPSSTESNTNTQSNFVFDVPALIGKNIDSIRTTLGNPKDNPMDLTGEQLKLGAKEWSNEWGKNGYSLTVTFNPTTRMVKDFFVGTNTSAEDKNPLLLVPLANLDQSSKDYEIEPVKQLKNPNLYTGIIITPR